eukprot:CAMPEP_0181401966 /NCGR_PEP_ID=MMETSP1110-20121109/2931_1 /TAXON_ID=174948 /ORGANISM="Symbiodinium sp., Strain CCMP421" /LENGTH=151 /DNA_ID=CAMNT_0023524169 /DNA_START=48 /DNA_END=502 /DNA_ORIENTATION=-
MTRYAAHSSAVESPKFGQAEEKLTSLLERQLVAAKANKLVISSWVHMRQCIAYDEKQAMSEVVSETAGKRHPLKLTPLPHRQAAAAIFLACACPGAAQAHRLPTKLPGFGTVVVWAAMVLANAAAGRVAAATLAGRLPGLVRTSAGGSLEQ